MWQWVPQTNDASNAHPVAIFIQVCLRFVLPRSPCPLEGTYSNWVMSSTPLSSCGLWVAACKLWMECICFGARRREIGQGMGGDTLSTAAKQDIQ